ncbi:MAG: molybdopterin molybdotransferase MoeA [Sulfurimonas sp.]|uniref:molybdopterin molybdotransferase MoeA n=1 Tax=Sulfurimonas sp. TaxID=2022749 RepID=UPI0025DF05A1|nr:molybdopterin molybdotransferase MoeA [Sulfurimonas sp.]MCK9491266.1 molybdopterin molybdotransferase MoeA [Sulfurimonas sp.]
MSVTILQALDFIYKNTKTKALKILPLEQALGFILAEDIYATHNLPPYDNSAMDGYAVKTSDANKCVKVEHTIFAGDNSSEILVDGYAIKIMTGARIPEGCECIVPQEETSKCQDGIKLPQDLLSGKHIRLCGEDIKKESLLLQKGQKLQAHQITLLASQGISHIKVHKKPRLALFASGNELKMHFEQVASYQLYNTNTPTLLARAEELGCEVEFIGTAEDTIDDLKKHIKSALNSDLIVTSGGVSVGDADFTQEAFASFGMETFFDKVEIKPGKPTAFGKIGDTLILNLPGNPLAAALNFELFGQSIILALSGANEKYLKGIDTKMKNEYKLKKSSISLVPGKFDGSSFTPCQKFAPGMVSPLAISNSYIMVDAGVGVLKKDEKVKAVPINFSFTTSKKEDFSSLLSPSIT